MYTTKQIIRKLVIGAAALTAAVCITLFIRENMDVKDPESALPSLTVTMNDTAVITPESVFRAGYEWNFLTTTAKNTPAFSSADLRRLTPAIPMAPRTYLNISFSIKPKSLIISRADDEKKEVFMDLVDVGDGPIITPAAPGLYMYRIQANFGWRGSIVYFFTVQIQETVIG